MQPRHQVNQYLKNSVEGVGQGELILVLYEAGITYLNLGKLKIAEKDMAAAHNALMRAIRVVHELMASLNMEKGGEIAQNLLRLYAFINRRIMEANGKKEPGGIDEALLLLTQLRETWKQALEKHQEEQASRKKEPEVPVREKTGEEKEESPCRISIRG